ncbi:unnamed protein product [Protopolystoma xenopodis]|uniref:Uncharacterized protein n=1 Tax=Protopolystoma xenopodis TaxID=117903 RepID=A0A3S5CRF2_9PLAT|nr:unnamed protein product [Protopolystoma xenopodis]
MGRSYVESVDRSSHRTFKQRFVRPDGRVVDERRMTKWTNKQRGVVPNECTVSRARQLSTASGEPRLPDPTAGFRQDRSKRMSCCRLKEAKWTDAFPPGQ